MEEHEQEGKEIEADLERNAALAVTAGSNLWMGVKQREHRRREAQQRDYEAVLAAELLLLTGRRDDGEDLARVGQKDADQEWARTGDPDRVVEAYAIADHYAEKSDLLANMRDNIGGVLTEYGLDPKEMLQLAPEQAAEQFRAARESSLTESDPDQLDREALEVARTSEQAQDMDSESAELGRDADVAQSHAEAAAREHEDTASQADAGEPGGGEPQRDRSQQVATAGTGPAVAAATYAATDHPTDPGKAAGKAPDRGQKPRSHHPGKGRKRGHGGRT